MISNIVGNDEFKPFDGWNPGDFTGLYTGYMNWGYSKNNQPVDYGATSVSSRDYTVGMHLNTFGHVPIDPEKAIIEAVQFYVGWPGHGKDLWNSKPNDDLCVEYNLDIANSYSSGSVNQSILTYIFSVEGTQLNFFLNVMQYDSRSSFKYKDKIIKDFADVGTAIISSYSKPSYDIHHKYTTGLKDKNTYPSKKGTKPNGSHFYGTCITKQQMEDAITGIKQLYGNSDNPRYNYNISNFNINKIRLKRVIPSIEINVQNGNGHMGVRYNNLKIYRFNNNTQLLTSIEQFVTRFYQQCLNRNPDSGGLTYWSTLLENHTRTGADVARGFIFSQEFTNRHLNNSDYIYVLYRAFFNREPDTGGYNYWLNKLNNGYSRDHVLYGFTHSQEFINLSNRYGIRAF